MSGPARYQDNTRYFFTSQCGSFYIVSYPMSTKYECQRNYIYCYSFCQENTPIAPAATKRTSAAIWTAATQGGLRCLLVCVQFCKVIGRARGGRLTDSPRVDFYYSARMHRHTHTHSWWGQSQTAFQAAALLPANSSTGFGRKWLYLTGLLDLIIQKCN